MTRCLEIFFQIFVLVNSLHLCVLIVKRINTHIFYIYYVLKYISYFIFLIGFFFVGLGARDVFPDNDISYAFLVVYFVIGGILLNFLFPPKKE